MHPRRTRSAPPPLSQSKSQFLGVFAGWFRFGGIFRRRQLKKTSSTFLVKKCTPTDKVLATPMLKTLMYRSYMGSSVQQKASEMRLLCVKIIRTVLCCIVYQSVTILSTLILTVVKLMADGPSFSYEKLVRETWYKKFVYKSHPSFSYEKRGR